MRKTLGLDVLNPCEKGAETKKFWFKAKNNHISYQYDVSYGVNMF